MERGYIKLYRSVMDNSIWKKKPFSYGQAWAHLILIANHKGGTIWVQGTPIKISRGQVGWSKAKLESVFGWTRSQLRTFIKRLKSDHMIDHTSVGKLSIITMLNYDKYHGNDQANDHPIAIPSPSHRHPIAINKNDKNNKKEKKEYISPRLGEHENVLLTREEFDKLHNKLGADALDDLIEKLSGYVASTGKKYKSHYATILNWHRKDKPKAGGLTPEQEKRRTDIKHDIKIIEDNLPGARARAERDPTDENKRDVKRRENKLAQLQAELKGMEG
jgi:hypothetical protein